MESLDYYISTHMNPYREDEGDRDQEDVVLAGEYQFKMDSIVEKIGTNECKHNIDLFLDELFEEMEFETLANFYNRCLTQLIEVYELHVLEDQVSNRYLEMNMEEELRKTLMFFEHEEWIEVFAKVIQIDKPQYFLRGDIVGYLNLHYNSIIDGLKNNKEQLSKQVLYQFMMGARTDTVMLINKLISSNKNGFVSQLIMNRGV